jgi:acyl-CoA thioesterase I
MIALMNFPYAFALNDPGLARLTGSTLAHPAYIHPAAMRRSVIAKLFRTFILILTLCCAIADASLAHAQSPPKVLVLGDSLSAEYGLKRGTGWVNLMQQKMSAEKLSFEVVNASISGETTSGGRTRLPALLQKHKPQVVIIELGANDALRGLDLASTEGNLVFMTQASKNAGASVLLVGMLMPPNYGKQYSQSCRFFLTGLAKTCAGSRPIGFIRLNRRSPGCSRICGRPSSPCCLPRGAADALGIIRLRAPMTK